MKNTGALEVRRHSDDKLHFFRYTEDGYETFAKVETDKPENALLIFLAPEMREQLEIVQAYLAVKNVHFIGIDEILKKLEGVSK